MSVPGANFCDGLSFWKTQTFTVKCYLYHNIYVHIWVLILACINIHSQMLPVADTNIHISVISVTNKRLHLCDFRDSCGSSNCNFVYYALEGRIFVRIPANIH
jgi:hypothetical protein